MLFGRKEKKRSFQAQKIVCCGVGFFGCFFSPRTAGGRSGKGEVTARSSALLGFDSVNLPGGSSSNSSA